MPLLSIRVVVGFLTKKSSDGVTGCEGNLDGEVFEQFRNEFGFITYICEFYPSA